MEFSKIDISSIFGRLIVPRVARDLQVEEEGTSGIFKIQSPESRLMGVFLRGTPPLLFVERLEHGSS